MPEGSLRTHDTRSHSWKVHGWTRLAAPLLVALGTFLAACENRDAAPPADSDPPRLVVGIVVDQMRPDYLYRYWDKYGDGGFKRLLREGFSFDNARFDYMPTYTGPGHASIYTGTTPAVHGVISNYWFSRERGEMVYVTADSNYRTVGAEGSGGQMSPYWLQATTLGDELRLHTNERSQVVGISLKDRSAILPAGHSGEAYWLDYDSGRIVTSTYYRDELPAWVKAFNNRELVERYLEGTWETLLPIDEYTESIADDNPYEAPFEGQQQAVFPYDLKSLREHEGPGLVAYTPFGNELLLELALAALEGESLGKGEYTDILAISFSSTDHIGHQFGPASVEVQDTYLRLDRQLEQLLDHLDEAYGRENVLVFLTSDHGAPHVPAYLRDRKIPAGSFDNAAELEKLQAFSQQQYGADLIQAFRDQQVFLDHDKLRENGLNIRKVREEIAFFLLEMDGVAGAVPAEAFTFNEFTEGIRAKVQRGYHQRRSGDVVAWLEPNWLPFQHDDIRTTHGSAYSYDTRAPLIWYGGPVPAGRSSERVHISDIAATLSVMIDAPFPGANTGNPMNPLMVGTD